MFDWRYLSFSQLDAQTLYQILALRSEVFVVEQSCVYQDIDGLDIGAIHLLGWSGDLLAAYLRIIPPIESRSSALGRVIIRESERGTGAGTVLVKQGIGYCLLNWPKRSIHISAQQHLVDFYGECGFRVAGEPYLEDGIPHIGMDYHPNSLP